MIIGPAGGIFNARLNFLTNYPFLGVNRLFLVIMIAAPERLKSTVGQPHLPDRMAAFGISGGIGQGIKRLFMTHPPLDERILALRARQRR